MKASGGGESTNVPDPVAKRFGENLRRCRRRAGLSQEELAFAAGLHRTEIGLLEGGERKARIDTLIKVACGLGVPIDDLVDGINWLSPEPSSGSFQIVSCR
jgi:transcriptional regulator with XRE-family HTH domain